MKSKRHKRHKWPSAQGAYRGGDYAAYRDGEKHGRPIYVPGRDPHAIYVGQQRESVIANVEKIVGQWSASPFEFEGAVRAGIRSGLCLGGEGWSRSDLEAASLLEQTFRAMGVQRPTWEQGQRQYTQDDGQCQWCGAHLPEEHFLGKRHKVYCSDVCARSAIEHRDFQRRSDSDKAFAAARRVVARGRTAPRHCAECGAEFRPIRAASAQRFCSQSCSAAVNSRRARELALARVRQCQFCGADFTAAKNSACFCSKRCSTIEHRLRHGTVPVRISVPVFDHFITLRVSGGQLAAFHA